eukprot:CAMPEP_0119273098 /NCGR_PEP_ID=MMETSP1329-20130426/9707_1 /TAXON_ID=114041 /ORGANISM="Genus nov. species nov., Strain RCC1024" /LENGTH=85 /DNA_ID=CAMNT_0007273271 /DNA_START=17 /DNA_END=271 /DNA_ORIENTATION=+
MMWKAPLDVTCARTRGGSGLVAAFHGSHSSRRDAKQSQSSDARRGSGVARGQLLSDARRGSEDRAFRAGHDDLDARDGFGARRRL